jgi:hypothetical protein
VLVVAALVLIGATVATAAPAGAAPPIGTVESFPTGPELTAVHRPVPGPGGTTWFVSPTSDAIGRVAADGTVTAFTHPDVGEPLDITLGPDGNLWFVASQWHPGTRGVIGKITPTGTFTLFPSTDVDQPSSIVAGPDGKLWFTDAYGDLYWVDGSVGTITTAGVIEVFGQNDDFWYPRNVVFTTDGVPWSVGAYGDLGTSEGGGRYLITEHEDLRVAAITPGADGTLWAIGSRSWPQTSVEILRFPRNPNYFDAERFAPTVVDPVDLLTMPGDVVWVADATGSVVSIEPDGTVTTIPTPGLTPDQLTRGADGNVWFADGTTVGRVNRGGGIDLFTTPYPASAGFAAGGDGSIWFANAQAAIGRIVSVDPAAPVALLATAGKEQATVSWSAPPVPTAPVAGYRVTASPGGATCTTSGATTCTIAGLAGGASTTFTVSALDGSAEVLATSAPSNAVVPWSGSTYVPVPPTRILDSRTSGLGFTGPVTSAQPRSLQITGLGGASNVPASATAVVMNVTATDSTAESYLTVYPTGTTKPNASNLNFGAGQVVANLVTVKLGTGGKVDIATAVGSTNVVADVVGYYDDGTAASGNGFVPVEPRRLHDSREPEPGTPLTADSAKTLELRTLDDTEDEDLIPSTAQAIVVNLTVTGATDQSYIRATSASVSATANVSNLNFLPNQTVANLAVVAMTGDTCCLVLDNAVGSVHVIVDLVGYFDSATGSRFHAMDPNRVLDTRTGAGLTGTQGPGQTRALAVAGAAESGVPSGATGLVANLTVADGTAESFAAIFPGDVDRPDPFSNVNFGINQAIPNLTTVGVAPDGSVNLYNHLGATHLILDAVGWYAPW